MPDLITSIELEDGQVLNVVGFWDPDPLLVEARMVEMAQQFENWKVPLTEAKQVMIESTRRRFREENAPDGTPWQDLDDEYWHEKVELGGYPDEILVRTDKTRLAATSEEAWFVAEHEIFFNPEVLPKNDKGDTYGLAHQTLTGVHTGKGAFLPPRPFIGADDEAISEIEAIFIQYLDETTVVTTGGVKGIATGIPKGEGQMVRGAFGRFIGKTEG